MKYTDYMKSAAPMGAIPSMGPPALQNPRTNIPYNPFIKPGDQRGGYNPPGKSDFNPPDPNKMYATVMRTWYNPNTGQEISLTAGYTPKPGTGWVPGGMPGGNPKSEIFDDRRPYMPRMYTRDEIDMIRGPAGSKPVSPPYKNIIGEIDGPLVEDVRRAIEQNPKTPPIKIEGGWLLPGGIAITGEVYNELVRIGVIVPAPRLGPYPMPGPIRPAPQPGTGGGRTSPIVRPNFPTPPPGTRPSRQLF